MIALNRALVALAVLTAAPPAIAYGPTAASAPSGMVAPAARGAAATIDAFHAALRRGDTRGALALLANDVLIFESGGVERNKAEYQAHHLGADGRPSGSGQISKAVPSTVTRRVGDAAGTIAWVASEGRTTGTFNGKPINQKTTETMILRRVGRAWRIVQIHWSSAKAR